MKNKEDTDFGELLAAADRNEPSAFNQLVEAVYPELKKLARIQLSRERKDHSLNTTAIVHEAYMKLSRGGGWADRRHFLRASAKVMRHLLVDHARKRNSQKRGSGQKAMTLNEALLPAGDDAMTVLALDNALEDMSQIDPKLEAVIECRFFAGLSVSETAEALNTSNRTVERDSQRARAYLLSALENVK